MKVKTLKCFFFENVKLISLNLDRTFFRSFSGRNLIKYISFDKLWKLSSGVVQWACSLRRRGGSDGRAGVGGRSASTCCALTWWCQHAVPRVRRANRMNNCVRSEWIDATVARAARVTVRAGTGAAWRGAPRRASLVPVVGSATERLREPSPPRRRSLVVVVCPSPGPAGVRAHGNPESGSGQKPRRGAQRSGVRVLIPGIIDITLFPCLMIIVYLQEDVRRRSQLAD